VLIDSEFHCQIAGFGLSRHLDATVTKVASSILINFAAPELFGICVECGGSNCDECREDNETTTANTKRKTKETDIYAFGCLYYTVSTLTYIYGVQS
jgi:serine/threonine protein kinase